MEDGISGGLRYNIKDEPSIIEKLKSSMDFVRGVKKKNSESPKKLEIKIGSSYILNEKSINFSNFLTQSDQLSDNSLNSKPDSHFHISPQTIPNKFTTKIEFVKPKQRDGEDSPCSVDSEPLNSNKYIGLEIEINKTGLENRLKNISNSQNLEKIKIPQKSENLKKAEKLGTFGKPENSEKPENLKILNQKEIIQKAKAEISELRRNKNQLQEKIFVLEDSLEKIEAIDQEEVSTVNSIEGKLERLERQQLRPEEDTRLREAISKISNLESEIVKLKSLKESSVSHYEEELKDVYHKLKDLQECNEILNEMVLCFKKEPILTNRNFLDSLPSTEPIKTEVIGTIKLSGLQNSQTVLQEAYEKKDQLMRTKDLLESEYKSLPEDSKSMANKRRKLALEFELSVNYSQLVSINNKIKRYTS
jgi:DNA repair exonuclease SbcCD ATPase subunit